MNVRLLLIAILLPITLLAQIEQRRTPRSWSMQREFTTPEIRIDFLDPLALRADAQLRDQQGGAYRVGREVAFRATPASAGRWFRDSNGNHFWTLRIAARNAQAISVLFESLILPRGSELYAYSADRSTRRGAFTERNNRRSHWAIAPIRADEIVLEYWAPAHVTERPRIEIAGIGYFFRGFERDVGRDYGDAGACQVNANCSEGDGFTDQRKAVVRIITKGGPFFGFCSGTVMNNTRAGCDAYVLSADHCAENTSLSDYGQWTFYFNYEAPGCSDPGSDIGLDLQSMVGCTKRASTGVGDISSGSDFLLVELNNTIPGVYGTYYAGWTRGLATGTGVTVHHPSGDLKKVSTYLSQPLSTSWPASSTPNRHWLVNWQSTANGHGTTEGGSSGAPLFNDQGLVYGVLSGGFSSCSDLTGADFYGKFSTAWNTDGNTPEFRLAPWLDPLGLGLNALSGTYPPCEAASLDEESLRWNIFPNPAVGRLHLDVPLSVETVRVIDPLGQVVWSSAGARDQWTIDVSTWPRGVYLVHLVSRGNGYSKAVVLQ